MNDKPEILAQIQERAERAIGFFIESDTDAISRMECYSVMSSALQDIVDMVKAAR